MKGLACFFRFLSSILILIVLILAILLVGMRFFGFEIYTVLSGSMEPEYRTGSLIYVKPVDPAELAQQDVITYRLTGDTVATHRIIEVQGEGDSLSFITKGDANEIADSAPVTPSQIIGSPLFTVPGLGYLSVFLQSRQGRIVTVSAGMFLLLLVFLPDFFSGSSHKNTQGKEEAH